MPGVIVQTGVRVGASQIAAAPAATFFVAGLTERGDVAAPVAVRSMAEYTRLLGARVTYGAVYDALNAYFDEGGTLAYVARAVGAGATLGTISLKDRSGAGGINTLRIDAINPGAWSTQISVQVDDGAVGNTFKLTILLNGVAVESYNNLATPAAAAALLTAQSSYVNAVDLGSVSAAPINNPIALAATALTAGTDNRGSVTASTVTAAAARFAADLGPGAIAAPGYDAATVAPALIAHARLNNRVALLAPAAGQTAAQVQTTAAALRGSAGSEFAGLFYPWVKVPDGAGGARTVSPEGYVAGVRARTQVETGDPGQPPAAAFAESRHVIGLETQVDKPTADTLNDDANVNVIRTIAGTIQLYGWRSLSSDAANYQMLSARDTMNYVAGVAAVALVPLTFRKIDNKGHLYADVHSILESILRPMADNGTLYARVAADGKTVIDPGYRVDTGPDVNTVLSLGRNELNVAVTVRVSPDAELIIVTITKVTLAQAA